MLIYFKVQNLKPYGLTDLTASTASNVLPHKTNDHYRINNTERALVNFDALVKSIQMAKIKVSPIP